MSLLLAGCGDDATVCGRDATGMHVCGAHVRDTEGRAVVLRGVNLAGAHKMSPYTDTFTPADYERLHAWGFRTLRFLVPWASIEPTPGAYNDAHLDWVRERMQWAHAAGLNVVLDMHQDVWSVATCGDGAPEWAVRTDGIPMRPCVSPWSFNYLQPAVVRAFDNFWLHDRGAHADLQDRFAALWRTVAERFRDHPAVLGYDVLNEPFAGSLFDPFESALRRSPDGGARSAASVIRRKGRP